MIASNQFQIMTSAGPTPACVAFEKFKAATSDDFELLEILKQLCVVVKETGVEACLYVIKMARNYSEPIVKFACEVLNIGKITGPIVNMGSKTEKLTLLLKHIRDAEITIKAKITFSAERVPTVKLYDNAVIRFSANDVVYINEAMVTGAWGDISNTYVATMQVPKKFNISEFVTKIEPWIHSIQMVPRS